MPFDDIPIARALRQRFVEGLNWEETCFAWDNLDNIMDGHYTKEKHPTKTLWYDRCEEIDKLYENIKKNGIISQGEILGDNSIIAEDEITVRIGRNGGFLFEDGRHRLAIAKLLNISSIPIKVTIRHKKWVEFREQIKAYISKTGSNPYQEIPHPDLADLSTVETNLRWKIIEKSIPISFGTVLDIGAYRGYFCHCFENKGFSCVAVENNHMDSAHFATKLRDAAYKKFQIYTGSIFDYYEQSNFDIILALCIFHHFLKTKEDYNKLIKLLNRLKAPFMYLETHDPNEDQMLHAYKNYNSKEFVNFILDNSDFNYYKIIGKTFGERRIYLISRDKINN